MKLTLLKGQVWDIDESSIMYISSDNDMSQVFYLNSHGMISKMLVNKRIGDLEKMLNNSLFYRAHKSYLVNVNHVDRYEEYPNNSLNLSFTFNIPLSRRKRQDFHNFFLKNRGRSDDSGQ